MSFVANAWKALARIDDEFVEFGRMPQRDEFWDDGISEEPVYSGWTLALGYWLIGWWIPVIAALLIVGYLINWNWVGLW